MIIINEFNLDERIKLKAQKKTFLLERSKKLLTFK
jgi:hypothetical protein